MRLGPLLAALAGGGAGLLLYGALVEAYQLYLERRTLWLPDWPKDLDGLRVGFVTDIHLRCDHGASVEHAQRALRTLIAENPDVLVMGGDQIAYWRPEVPMLAAEGLAGLEHFEGRSLAIRGNHDTYGDRLEAHDDLLRQRGVQVLVNECATVGGVCWAGIDSGNTGKPAPHDTLRAADWSKPVVVLWHEPDFADLLPKGPALMLSGHSHGGQFVTPWGWAPMTATNGKKYQRGLYAEPPCPLYVSRGLATTGPPSRWNCPPEVAVLTLRHAAGRPTMTSEPPELIPASQ